MAETTAQRASVNLGLLQGTIPFSTDVLDHARQAALRQYEAAVDAEFCGDPVETYSLPDWLPPLQTWLPLADLASIGLEPNPADQPEMVGTCGVDHHVDNIHGLVLAVVLYNDELKFHQGRHRHVTAPGQWFVFDDRLPHQVKETASSSCYLCITVPLQRRAS
jgi:hypothetical protein